MSESSAPDPGVPAGDGPRAAVSRVVDARGLACPMPVIELARAIEDEAIGAIVQLLATDPAAKVDVPVWCRMQRQGLRAATEDEDGTWVFLVEKQR